MHVQTVLGGCLWNSSLVRMLQVHTRLQGLHALQCPVDTYCVNSCACSVKTHC